MPKINVYLPDQLAEQVKQSGVPVSAVCQRALDRAVRADATEPLSAQPTHFGVYGRFLARARASVELAYAAAERKSSPQLTPELLLLGILEQGDNLAVAIVERLGGQPDELLLRINDGVARGDTAVHNMQLDAMITPGTRAVFALAVREAARLDHPYIGTEHLLFGIASEAGTPASGYLAELSITPQDIRLAHEDLLSAWASADAVGLADKASR